jgi:DNA-binding response OmpR family regulator
MVGPGRALPPARDRLLLTFEDHTLDTDRRELRRGSMLLSVQPQVFDLLVFLIRNRDHGRVTRSGARPAPATA